MLRMISTRNYYRITINVYLFSVTDTVLGAARQHTVSL
jgi:hypothetical protein